MSPYCQVVGGWGSVLGCAAEKRNVCCLHRLGPHDGRRLRTITDMLRAYVRRIGKDRSQSCDELFVLEGRDGEGDPGDAIFLIVLLVDARYKPEVQYFSPARLPGARSWRLDALPPPPFVVEVQSSAPLVWSLGRPLRSVRHLTSDELAWEAIPLKASWCLRPLQQLPEDGPSLLRMRVVAIDDAFVPPVRQPRRARAAEAAEGADVLGALSDHPWSRPVQDEPDEPGPMPAASSESDEVMGGLEDGCRLARG